MDDRGLISGFIVCKIGVALAALVFLGAILSMYSSMERLAGREELEQAAGAIASAIEAADSMPGEVEMWLGLPAISQEFEVLVVGERNGEVQMICMRVVAGPEVERVLVLSSQVNSGEFKLTVKNPRQVHLRKAGTIQLELV